VFVVCFVGSGLCDELITRSEESYRARARARACVCLIVCDLENCNTRRPKPQLVCVAAANISAVCGARRS